MRRTILAAAAVFVAVGAANADENWPERTVTIIAPFAPGGIIDIAARIVGEELSDRWGVQVVVENRAGGSGFIGAQAAAQADADGYTLFAAEAGVSIINDLIFDETPYDMAEDFVPIITMTDTPIVLAAHTGADVTTVEEFLAMSRAEGVNYASPANGTLNHITGEWMALEADLDIEHIGYRGGGPAGVALASGEVPFGVLAYSSVLPYVDSGDVVIVAVTSAERVDVDPDLPTLQEGGIPNVDTTQWSGLFAVAGTPEAIIDRIHADVMDVLADPEVQERFAAVGSGVIPQSREDFVAQLARQGEDFARIVGAAGVVAE